VSRIKDQLQLTTMVASAIALTSCNAQRDEWGGPTAVCTDAQGARIADSACGRSGGTYVGGSHGGRWVYLNRGNTVPAEGDRVIGGSYAPSPGVHYAPASSIARGGFGSSAHFGGVGG